jgi:DNA-binding transcriptional MerR regulator
MADSTRALVLWRTEHSLLTLEDLANAAGLCQETLQTFVGYRLIEPSASVGSCPLFSTASVERLQRILRLRHELGVNLAGLAVILDMTERVEKLQKELDVLRNRI